MLVRNAALGRYCGIVGCGRMRHPGRRRRQQAELQRGSRDAACRAENGEIAGYQAFARG